MSRVEAGDKRDADLGLQASTDGGVLGRRFKSSLAPLIILCLTVTIWIVSPGRDPVYQGKALRTWLAESSNAASQAPITNAVRQIGVQGIPSLLGMLRRDDFFLGFQVLDRCVRLLVPKQHLSTWDRYKNSHMNEARSRRVQAVFAFGILGSAAQCAVPELMKLYKREPSPDHRFFIEVSLASIGATEAMPLIMADVADTNPIVRLYAVDALSLFVNEPGIVVPELMKLRTDADFRVRGLVGLRLRNLITNVAPALSTMKAK